MRVRRKTDDGYLAHHGIKNQHWGVRNGPPYPLDKKVSKAIKRGKNETRNEGKIVGTQHSKAALGGSYTRNFLDVRSMSWDDFFKQPESYKKQYRNTDLGLKEVNQLPSGNWKNALETSDVSSLLNSNFKNELKNNSLLCIDSSTKQDIAKNGFSDHKDLLLKINSSQVDSNTVGTMNNCSKCSDMVELVQRGLNPNTFSAGRSNFGMLSSAPSYHWDGAVSYKEKSYDNIEKKILSFGNKGSGTIGIRRSDGSGHAMHFSVVNGHVEVQDGQIGKVYSSLKDALTAESHDENQFCHITRLDNATPNVKHMVEDSVVRMDRSDDHESLWPSGVQFNNSGSGNVWINNYNSMSSLTESNNSTVNSNKSKQYWEGRR